MVNNLEFAYADGLRKDESAETGMRISINMWLDSIEKEINENNIVVCVVFLSNNKTDLFLSGADDDLQKIFLELKKRFQ